MIDWTKPVRTKGSKEIVRVLCTDAPDWQHPVVVLIGRDVERYAKNGTFYFDGREDDMNLENVPEETSTPTEVMLLVVDGVPSVSATYWHDGGATSSNERWVKFREVKE